MSGSMLCVSQSFIGAVKHQRCVLHFLFILRPYSYNSRTAIINNFPFFRGKLCQAREENITRDDINAAYLERLMTHKATVNQIERGKRLVEVHALVADAGTTGTTDVQIANTTQAIDMLSTKLTVDSGEVGSDTAAAAAVIDQANLRDRVLLNDILEIDVDAIQSGTAPNGLFITLGLISSKPSMSKSTCISRSSVISSEL